MADPLRQLSTRELIARTFSLYRRNFKLFIGVSIIGPVATLVYRLLHIGGTVVAARAQSTSTYASMVIGIVIGITITLAGLAISSAATVKAVAAACFGRRMRVSDAYRILKGRFWRIIGLLLSVFVRVFLGGCLFIFLGVISLGLAAALGYNSRVEAGMIGAVCGVIAGIASIVASIGIYVRYAVAVQACVVEDISRKLALKRSTFLTEGNRSRVATVFMILSFVPGLVLAASTLLLRGHGIAFQIAYAAASLIAGALTAPLGTISMSLVYYDQRVRKESFDVQVVMDALGPSSQPVAESL